VRRGDIVMVSAGEGFAGTSRPAVVIQADGFEMLSTLVLCVFTTNLTESPDLRVTVEPGAANALPERSALMVDKLISVPRRKIGRHIGRLEARDLVRLDRALLVFLGLAG